MQGLVTDAGKWRLGQVGILKGSKVSHVAPPAKRIPELMETLFSTLKKSKEHFAAQEFSRIEYLKFFKSLSTATASRDLKFCVDKKLLIKYGDKAQSVYRFKN